MGPATVGSCPGRGHLADGVRDVETIPKPAGPVFADYVNFSFPWDDSAGVFEDLCDLSGRGNFEGADLYRTLDGGTIKHGRRAGVRTLSLSGAVLRGLRQDSALLPSLGVVGSLPHRVTTLHATLDLLQEAPPVVARMYERGKSGLVFLTRKSTPPVHVQKVVSRDPEGRDTGTVYLGSRKSDVWLKVYDKRAEMIARFETSGSRLVTELWPSDAAYPDPMTRYELCLGRKVGVTLRDVAEPAGVFWHFMRGTLPELVPADFKPWVSQSQGFEVARRDPLPYASLELALDAVHPMKRIARLCEALGPSGVDLAAAGFRRRLERLVGAARERLEGASPSHP